jgi:hypothetical protein
VYLAADMAVLWVSFEATGVTAPVAVLVLAYLIGYLANVLPIPGGIGILDGGIVGALVLYHTPAASAAAAVLLYHTIALWIPTLGGAIAFASSRTPPARESAGRGTRLFALLPYRPGIAVRFGLATDQRVRHPRESRFGRGTHVIGD